MRASGFIIFIAFSPLKVLILLEFNDAITPEGDIAYLLAQWINTKMSLKMICNLYRKALINMKKGY